MSNANRYYERDALVADPDYGSILSSLLVGPCALEYSKAKAPACFWTDPPADELVSLDLSIYKLLYFNGGGLHLNWLPDAFRQSWHFDCRRDNNSSNKVLRFFAALNLS